MANLAPNGKPKVAVKLVGEDSHAFAIMGRVTGAMRRAGWTEEERRAYTNAAMAGDYDNLLRVTVEYTDDPSDDEEDDEDDEDDEVEFDECGTCGEPQPDCTCEDE